MPKKDVYASIGTILIFGFILLLLLWLKLIVPAHLPEEQGIEVGYGVDMEGEIGGSSGGQRGDFGGSLDGDFYKKQIDAPSFSEKPVQQARSTSSQTSDGQAKATVGGDDFFTQDEESLNVPTGNNTDRNSQAAEQQRLAQEAARAAEQKAKSDRAKSLGVNAFGNSGGNGSGGFGMGSGNGPGSGTGKGNGIGDGTGDGTRGNPFGKGTSTELLEPLIDSPTLLLVVIMIAVFIIGMVMDLTPTVLILTPVLMPLVEEAGIDPVYFGVLFILNTSIGLITPPVGNVLNVITGVSKLPFDQAAKGILPYMGMMVVLLFLFVFFPSLILVPLQWML